VKRPSVLAGEPSAEDFKFIFVSERPCLALCATVGERWRGGFERLRSRTDLARWYAEASVVTIAVPVTESDLEQARTVREAVYRSARALLGHQAPAHGDEQIVNDAAAVPPPIPRAHRGVLLLAAARPSRAASALSAVARDAISLFTSPDAARLRECASPECGLLFTDTSRPGRRLWCSSSACGSRARAAAYRRRRTAVGLKVHQSLPADNAVR
jgi:predicted RNA-binding Zn ribbon-like protein